MESLVFVGYFGEVIKASKRYTNFFKILIIETSFSCEMEELKSYFDDVILVEDSTDPVEMSTVIEEIQKNNTIHALYANHEWVVEVCGYLREKFHIPGLKEMVCKKSRDKFLMKKVMSEAGIKTANVECIESLESINRFIEKNEYPVVIKPRNGAATQNTFLIHNEDELQEVINLVDVSQNFIIEPYIKGEEYHCDSIVINGEVVFSSVSKYLANCIQTIKGQKPVASITFPSTYDDNATISKIKKVNEKAISALGVETSICHLEVFITEEDECIFGEIATRIGGGDLIGNTIKYAYGVNLYDAFIEIQCTGEFHRESVDGQKFVGFVALPTKEGKVVEIATEDDYKNKEDVKEVRIYNHVGDYIDENINTTKRTGYVIVEGKDYKEVAQKLMQIYEEFKLVVEIPRPSLFSIYN